MSTLSIQPYNYARAITPSNTIDIWQTAPVNGRRLTDAIQFGTGGTAAVVLEDDTVCSFTVIAGQVLPIRAKRLNSTGTAATLPVGLWLL